MTESVEIKYICEDFLIAYKPHNLPTVPLKNQMCRTLLSELSVTYPELLRVTGKHSWEGSAMHRLDTATEGLVVFARNQNFYDYLSRIQDNNLLKKTYTAKCCGSIPRIRQISTYFRSFGPRGAMVKPEEKPENSDNCRKYTTTIENVKTDGEFNVFQCIITKGFRHQIRSHLSSIGCPIVGDPLYNKLIVPEADSLLMLNCTAVEFPLPDGKIFRFENAN